MSQIVEVAKSVEPDHAIVFVKTVDGEVHGFEFGQHHPSHGESATATETHHEHHHKHHQHHHDHQHGAGHATFNPNHYTVVMYSPFALHPRGNVGVPKTGWVAVHAPFTPESLNEHLKSEWYKEHVGCFVFENEGTFTDHVFALLSTAPEKTNAPQ